MGARDKNIKYSHREFEDVLDNINEFQGLFSAFWEYLGYLIKLETGCLYVYDPSLGIWKQDYIVNPDNCRGFPVEIAEENPVVLDICSSEFLTQSSSLSALGVEKMQENLEGFPPETIFLRFGTSHRAPAFITMIPGNITGLTDIKQLESVRRAVKSTFRAHERIEITNQLVAADKSITVSEVAAGIAHEINNNITPIIGRSQILQMLIKNNIDDLTIEKILNNVDIIYRQSCKIARIAQNLTRLSQPMKVEFNEVNLEKELRDVVEIMSETAGKIKHFKKDNPDSQYKINFDFPDTLPKIRGDSQQLEQVFINLIINAAHAVEVKEIGTLTVGAYSGENYVTAFIKDDGIGMTPETIDKMWKPFFTTKKKGRGTGLGMAIVKNIIKAHGGEIKVISELGVGTTFELEFNAI